MDLEEHPMLNNNETLGALVNLIFENEDALEKFINEIIL